MNSHPDHPSGPAVMVELSQLDLRYEGCRLKSPVAEARLLAAIAQVGMQQPLRGVELSSTRMLLDGFKRLRCAKKLHLSTVPFVSLAPEEATGIICLLRAANDQTSVKPRFGDKNSRRFRVPGNLMHASRFRVSGAAGSRASSRPDAPGAA
jgi:hypothetical protein